MTAIEIINESTNGNPNLMTPKRVKAYKINEHTAIEVSKGKGLRNNTIYGVTYVTEFDISIQFGCLCHSTDEVLKEINKIRVHHGLKEWDTISL